MQRWEEGCDDEDEGGGVGGGEGNGGGDGHGGDCTPDDDDDGLHAYIERWGRAQLQWPRELRAAAERPCPPSRQVAATACAVTVPSPIKTTYIDWRDINWNAPDATVKGAVDGGFNVVILAFFFGGQPTDMLQVCSMSETQRRVWAALPLSLPPSPA